VRSRYLYGHTYVYKVIVHFDSIRFKIASGKEPRRLNSFLKMTSPLEADGKRLS
jgi:hypothetical protein